MYIPDAITSPPWNQPLLRTPAYMFIFSCLPLFPLQSALDRSFKNFSHVVHVHITPAGLKLPDLASPGLSSSFLVPFHTTHSTLVMLAVLSSLHQVTCIPILGLLQTLVSLTGKHSWRLWLSSILYDIQISAFSGTSAYLFSNHSLYLSFFFMGFMISWYYLIYLLIY